MSTNVAAQNTTEITYNRLRIMVGSTSGRVASIIEEAAEEAGMLWPVTAGDTNILWDPSRKAELKAAKKIFDDLKKEGYIAYAVEKDGKKGEIIREFDPEAGKLIMAPPMAGG